MKNPIRRLLLPAVLIVLTVAAGVLAGGVSSSTLMIPDQADPTALVPYGYPLGTTRNVNAFILQAKGYITCQQGGQTECFGAGSGAAGGASTVLGELADGSTWNLGVALGKKAMLTANSQFVLGSSQIPMTDGYMGSGVTSPDLASTPVDFSLHASGGVYIASVANPAAPPALVIIPGGGTFTPGVTGFVFCWLDKFVDFYLNNFQFDGSTLPSPAATISIGAGDSVQVTWGAFPVDVTGVRVFSETAPGSGIYAACATFTAGTAGVIFANGASIPPPGVNDTGSSGAGHALVAAGGDADPASAPATPGGSLHLRPGLSSDAATAGASIDFQSLPTASGRTPVTAWRLNSAGQLVRADAWPGAAQILGPTDQDLQIEPQGGNNVALVAGPGNVNLSTNGASLLLHPTAAFFSGAPIDAGAHQAKNLADPTDPQDALTLSKGNALYAPIGNPPQFNFTQNSLALSNGSNNYDFAVGGFTLYCWSAVVWPGDAGNIIISVSQSRVGADTARITINYTYTAGTAGQVDVILFYL